MWPNPQEPADLVTFTDEILNGKLRFLCSVKNLLSNLSFILLKSSAGLSFLAGHVDNEQAKNAPKG